ncbi:MAG: signal peptide peptidase SppA [Candidatus Rokuibacteriota bacterium]|nr:MAG: signal peptide peptidase SppA [Candidatus Rokubacteria bacterium]
MSTRLTVLLVLSLLGGCSLISIDLTPRIRSLEEHTVEGTKGPKILLTDISGFLSEEGPSPVVVVGTSTPRVGLLVRFREELKKASEDAGIRALVIRINSPGGTVTASDIMFNELDTFKRSARVPVIAVMMDVAASGGYYVALAADTIVAHPTSVTGSIGVIMVTMNAEGLMQKLGLTASAIKSGERKDMGSPFRALSDDERRIFQSVIDGLHGQFVAKVVETRKIPIETARAVADGRIYTAQQALERKLVDRIGYMDDAIAVARRAIGADEARVVVYRRPREHRETYYARAEAPASSLEATLTQLSTTVGAGPRFLYLWWP